MFILNFYENIAALIGVRDWLVTEIKSEKRYEMGLG
jgi:hypothetical protein